MLIDTRLPNILAEERRQLARSHHEASGGTRAKEGLFSERAVVSWPGMPLIRRLMPNR